MGRCTRKRNDYIPIDVHWSEVRAETRSGKETIRNTSESQFNSEFECEFLGSIDTLISPVKLKQLTYRTPIHSRGIDVHVRQKDSYIHANR